MHEDLHYEWYKVIRIYHMKAENKWAAVKSVQEELDNRSLVTEFAVPFKHPSVFEQLLKQIWG